MMRARSDLKVTASDALEFEAVEPEARPRSRRGLKVLLWLVVIGAAGGGAWVAYGDRLMDWAGAGDLDVPLIRAMAGPVKVRPENPGGLQVPNRDKLVYGRLQKGGEAEGPPIERLLPKPEAPLPMAPATPADAAFQPSEAETAAAPAPTPTPVTAKVPKISDVQSVQPPPPPPAAPGAAKAPVRLSKGSGPLRLKKGEVRAPTQPAPAATRPEPVTAAPAPQVAWAPAAAATQPAKPAAPAGANQPGAYRVQLAAARSPERARSEWDRMRRKHLDLLGDLGLTVTKADLGPTKGVFYRLRVGPLTSEAQARALCKELSKRKMGCLVVKPGR